MAADGTIKKVSTSTGVAVASYARRKIMKALRTHGIVVEREGARHTVVVRSDGRKTTIPRQSKINRRTAHAIADQLELDWEAFQGEIS